MKKRIPLAIIRTAKAGDEKAIAYIMNHRANYIASVSTIRFTEKYGVEHRCVDEDLYAIGMMALYQAIMDFEIKEPPKDTSST